MSSGWSQVEFFESGDGYFSALKLAFRAARESICLEFYIFRMDRLGRELLEELCACQARGVKVFLRLDGVGSRENLAEIAEYCNGKQLELEVFHPLPFEGARKFFPVGFSRADTFLGRWRFINRRNHRKLVIIDETIAFAGGMNVDEVQSERFGGRKAWHDLSLRLEGPAVDELSQAFWFKPFRNFSFRHCLLNYSWRMRRARNQWFSQTIRKARTRMWVVTPYFAPPPFLLYQIQAAVKRGVDIRFILTGENDVPISRLAALGLYRRLVKKGIRLFEFQPSLLHRKLWLFDDVALVGSGNLNHRSFLHDLELDVILRDPAHLARAAGMFSSDEQKSREVTEVYLEKISLREKFLSWVAGWFTYWL